MFDNIMYLEQLLHNIQCELFDIDHLEHTEFVNRIMCYPLNGIEDRILIMIRQAVCEFQNQRAIMKYIRVVDKLTKIASFKAAIHNHIVEIYSQTFYFLFLQKCNKDLEELKILRKYWVGLIHPFQLTRMKETVFSKTNIDIDTGIKPDTVSKIRQHYATRLNMSAQEINSQFPTARSVEDPRLSNKSYNLDFSNVYTPNYPLPPPTLINNNYNTVINPTSNNWFPQNMNKPTFVSSAHQISNLNTAKSQNLSPFIQTANQNEADTKRKRLSSEETRSLGGMIDTTNDPRPRKVPNSNENKVDHKSILAKCKELNHSQCKECGMMFVCKEFLQTHKNKHLKDKLLKIDGIAPIQGSGLCARDQWLKIDQEQLTNESFQITEKRWSQHTAICIFCCSLLAMQFKHDQWVFVNATIVSLEGKQQIMHKSCQVILQKGQQKLPNK